VKGVDAEKIAAEVMEIETTTEGAEDGFPHGDVRGLGVSPGSGNLPVPGGVGRPLPNPAPRLFVYLEPL